MRHSLGADFALIRKLPEHNRGLAAARIVIGKFDVTMTLPAVVS